MSDNRYTGMSKKKLRQRIEILEQMLRAARRPVHLDGTKILTLTNGEGRVRAQYDVPADQGIYWQTPLAYRLPPDDGPHTLWLTGTVALADTHLLRDNDGWTYGFFYDGSSKEDA